MQEFFECGIERQPPVEDGFRQRGRVVLFIHGESSLNDPLPGLRFEQFHELQMALEADDPRPRLSV